MQKHVETLDAIRAKNAAAPAKANNGSMDEDGHAKARAPYLPPRVSQRRNFQPSPAPPAQSWESFDLLSSVPRPRPRAP